MNRINEVYSRVENIYMKQDSQAVGKWMWENHVKWVSKKAQILAQKYQADEEKVVVGALLHDLADARYERGHEKFDSWGDKTAREVLLDVKFASTEIDEIIKIIVNPHACRPDNLPTTLEGKVLATADAMFHLQTSFFPLFCFANRPVSKQSFEDWQVWFLEKIERDFHKKIFFEDERAEVLPDYKALKKVFANDSLAGINI